MTHSCGEARQALATTVMIRDVWGRMPGLRVSLEGTPEATDIMKTFSGIQLLVCFYCHLQNFTMIALLVQHFKI